MQTRNFQAELQAARTAGDWEAHARIWEERRLAEVDADEAAISVTAHRYIIMCYRSPGSICGAAERPMKAADGQIETFETFEAADQAARRLNAGLKTANVRYEAQESVGPDHPLKGRRVEGEG